MLEPMPDPAAPSAQYLCAVAALSQLAWFAVHPHLNASIDPHPDAAQFIRGIDRLRPVLKTAEIEVHLVLSAVTEFDAARKRALATPHGHFSYWRHRQQYFDCRRKLIDDLRRLTLSSLADLFNALEASGDIDPATRVRHEYGRQLPLVLDEAS